jgi:hypothetical protein
MGIKTECAGDEHVKIHSPGFPGRLDQIRAGHGAELRADENGGPVFRAFPVRLRGFGMGVTKDAGRRELMIFWVGWPVSSSAQCRPG